MTDKSDGAQSGWPTSLTRIAGGAFLGWIIACCAGFNLCGVPGVFIMGNIGLVIGALVAWSRLPAQRPPG
jgi:hypothetical protein